MPQKDFFTNLIRSGKLIVDSNGNAKLFDEFILLMPIGVLVKLRERLVKNIGEAKTNKIFMELGEFQVEAAAKRYIKKLNFQKIDKRKIMEFTSYILNILGWGNVIIEKFSFNEKTASIILKNSTFSLKYKLLFKDSNKPIDYWVAGMLKKHFSVIFETKLDIKEEKCMACGDNFCKFIIKPKL